MEKLQPSSPEAETCCGWIEDRISVLPDDLIVEILSLIPTKDAVTTMVLSKRWRSIWTIVPKIVCMERHHDGCKSISRFIDKTLELHKAPILETLCIQLGPQSPADTEIGKWVENAVGRGLKELEVELQWTSEPTNFPKSLYNCKTLVILKLSDKILVDVPSSVCLPSLKVLSLVSVTYKDDDSLVRLLSSCHVLKYMYVKRHENDNVAKFVVDVPSLQFFTYENTPLTDEGVGEHVGSLFINSPALTDFNMRDVSGDTFLVDNMPHLDVMLLQVYSYLDNKFLRSISAVASLTFFLIKETVANNISTITFSRLIDLKLYIFEWFDWLKPVMLFLSNCPNLKVLRISFGPSLMWNHPNQPSSVPECFLSHLKIFECVEYKDIEEEKELVTYIIVNSKCLERATISVATTLSLEEQVKVKTELESMFRVLTPHFLFE
ncbi:hypothetical protein CARUB_v10027931mg [Capsella rubella]|uniref:F-box domain-containing protein n=1 Tax=Capsella rubella TaxID=81985 RepID=R0GQN5_9BRAS|nr:hypothetical protein CARUB_v10027931mg [Capsella rubella]